MLYNKYFTQSEIDDFIAFHRNPAGQKMITVMPEMQKSIKEQMEEIFKNTPEAPVAITD